MDQTTADPNYAVVERELDEELALLERQIDDWRNAVRETEWAFGGPNAVAGPAGAVPLDLAFGSAPASAKGERAPTYTEPPASGLTDTPTQPGIDGREASAQESADGAPRSHRSAVDDEEDDDRKLLESLDEEALTWLRVRQRITNRAQNVRELLDEYAATKRRNRT